MAATHVIRTTFRPTDEITVSHDEYEDLLERGLIYDGTPPDPVADPLDAHLAERLADPDSTTRDVIDGLVTAAATGVQDPYVAGLVTNSASATSVALGAAFGSRGGPLGRWKAKLATDPANAKVVFLGDSTSDPALNASMIYRRILSLHTQQGEALYGLVSADYFTDGVGNGTTTFTSATANFTTGDVGRLVHGKGFPAGAIITARASATSVTLSTTIPTGTALPFWVGRHVIGGGNNGVPLVDWMANPSSGSLPYNRNKLVADAPDLIVASWLINDVRQGALGTTVDAIVTAGTARLAGLVDWIRANLSTADILLRMPNTLLSANVGGSNYVTDGTTNNPAGLAQTYSTALRRIYLSFVGKYPNVDVLDTQAEVFGTRSIASHPYMSDQLHPSSAGSSDVGALTPSGGGYVAIADAITSRIGFGRNAFVPGEAQRVRQEFIVSDGPSAGTVRLISRNPSEPAAQAAAFAGDSLYINGFDTPFALTTSNIDRNVSPTTLQITGLSTTDFLPYLGKTAVIVGNHAPSTTRDRQAIYIDLPSIAAGATVTQDVAVTGVSPGNGGSAAAAVAAPANGFANSGLFLLAVYVKTTDVVRLVIQNPTGAAIDMGGEVWTFWVVR